MINQRFNVEGRELRIMSNGIRDFGSTTGTAMQRTRAEVRPAEERVKADLSFTGGADVPISMMSTNGPSYNRFFTGMLPEQEESLIPYYRDAYYFDSVAGATVDMMSTFPFSEWTLVGLEDKELEVYDTTMARLNIRSLMGEASNSYLVDGAFIGSLVFDADNKTFQDVLIHDRLNCQISHRPFFALDPVIKANATTSLNNFLSSNSPYTDAVLQSYPRRFLEMFLSGGTVLDPITTIYIPRRGLRDQRTTSYLRRILPMYLLEKTLYRGTLLEAHRRMRATTHVQVGTDTWEPTPSEMETLLAQFQLSEIDPLGGWIVTRQGVNVQDIRTAGDFWKWTDLIDILVPYKLRALGISEAFLSGDAQYANVEAAIQVFMENAAAYRSYFDLKMFKEKLFPLIAVVHGFYKDASKVDRARTPEALFRNLRDHSNLKMPELRWHKSLDNHDPNVLDTLEKLSDKGIPVPMKMWAAAANVSLEMLLGDLKEDQKFRDRITKITGKPMDNNAGNGQGITDDMGGGDDGFGSMGFEQATLRALESEAEVRSSTNPVLSRRRSVLQRSFMDPNGNPLDLAPMRLSKSGKRVHSVLNETEARRRIDNMIFKAAKNLQDPNYRASIRSKVIHRLGQIPNITGAR